MEIRKTIIFFASSLFVFAWSVGCGGGSAEEKQGFTKEMALAKKKVEIALVRQLSFNRGIQATGSLEARNRASLRALVGGPLVAIHVDIGGRVSIRAGAV